MPRGRYSSPSLLHPVTECSIQCIQYHAFIPTLWDFNAKLVSPLVISLGHISNDATALLEHMRGTSKKIRCIMQFLGDNILSNLHMVALLEIFQMFPTYCPVFPFNVQVPTLGYLSDLLVASMFDIHISACHHTNISVVINNAFHKV
jgi:hypothetical protein